jgi:hypothetical protein
MISDAVATHTSDVHGAGTSRVGPPRGGRGRNVPDGCGPMDLGHH